MKILKFDAYKDGGTIEITTDKGVFCVDNRICTKTKNSLYNGYPKKDNSNIIENSDDLKKEILNALEKYDDVFYSKTIKRFLEENKNI